MYTSTMIDAASICLSTLLSLMIIASLVNCYRCYKHYQQRQTLPSTSIPPATHQPHIVSPMHRGPPLQSNTSTGRISHSASRLTSMSASSPIPRNYGMLHVPLADEEPNPLWPILINEIRRSIPVGDTTVWTYSSRTMGSMPREPPNIPADTALFKIALNLESDKSTECAVCLGGLQGEEQVVQLRFCVHLFHVNCIREWLRHQPSCPLCRSPAISAS